MIKSSVEIKVYHEIISKIEHDTVVEEGNLPDINNQENHNELIIKSNYNLSDDYINISQYLEIDN